MFLLVQTNIKNTHKVWRKISNFAIYRKLILIYIENYVLTKHKHREIEA